MPKTYILILAVALIATSCTPTHPTAQARVQVSLPWSPQQLTDSLKFLLAHVVRMDTAQYRLDSNRVFSMRPGATVQGLTVVGPLNVLAAPGNGLPDTIHLPHDSIPHLPGGGIEITSGAERFSAPVYLGGLAIAAPYQDIHINPGRGKVDTVFYSAFMKITPTKKTKRHAKH